METPGDAVHNDYGEVRKCNCGGLNLTVGAVTLHLAADEVARLSELVQAGLGLVDAKAKPPRRARRPHVARTVH